MTSFSDQNIPSSLLGLNQRASLTVSGVWRQILSARLLINKFAYAANGRQFQEWNHKHNAQARKNLQLHNSIIQQ